VIDVVSRRVVPVSGSFGPAAVGRERRHGKRDRSAGIFQNLARDFWLLVRDGERSKRQAAVTNLIPVERRLGPPAAIGINLQPGFETFGDNGLVDDGAVLSGEEIVEP